jgi:dCTP deaminase
LRNRFGVRETTVNMSQFALLLTEEHVAVPSDAIGFISIKAGIKFRGLVNVSGFHVDPGFRGRLKFSVYNAGTNNVVLERGRPTFLLWYSDLGQATEDVYRGSHQGQKGLTGDDVGRLQGDVASPSALGQRLEELRQELTRHEHKFNLTAWIFGVVLAALLGGLITVALSNGADTQPRQDPPAAAPAESATADSLPRP